MTVTARTALYAVLGRPIAHSLSPVLHQAAFAAEGRDAVYVACDVGAAELPAAIAGLRALGARGANLTAPLKTPAVALVDTCTAAAAHAGAVNTLGFADGRVSGHNTDGAGFVAFLARAGVALPGARVAILGAGGAALGLVGPLVAAGAATVTALVRDPARPLPDVPAARQLVRVARDAPAARAAVEAAAVVVQATPLGGAPGDPMPCPPEWLDARAVAVDLRYHPAATPWLLALRARGVRAANGLGLLIEQALLSQECWHGSLPPRPALEQAVACKDVFGTSPGASAG